MLVILDKDGTLIQPKSGHKFVQAPDDQELLPGVAQRVTELQEQGATLVIASNQGGVAAGHKTLEDAIAEMRYCMNLIGENGAEIDYSYFCPDFEGEECWAVHATLQYHLAEAPELTRSYRKPNPGMLLFAKQHYEWRSRKTASDVIMIGDRPEDVAAAKAAGMRFIDAAEWRLDGIPLRV